MSILNHFGKVNTSYTSKYEDVKWRRYLHFHDRILRTKETVEILEYTGFTSKKYNAGIYDKIVFYTDEAKQKKTILFDGEKGNTPYYNLLDWFTRPCFISASPTIHPREYILEDFPDIVKKITNKHPLPILSGLNLPQMVTLPELIWVKVDDVDSRVDHLEKMLAQVIDDTKLLQRKVDALEQKLIREYSKCVFQELD
jgi:hypothetical protein